MSDRRTPAQIAEDIAELSDAELGDLARILLVDHIDIAVELGTSIVNDRRYVSAIDGGEERL